MWHSAWWFGPARTLAREATARRADGFVLFFFAARGERGRQRKKDDGFAKKKHSTRKNKED
jgi:hypothetical protein